jgi:hypothetical protein
MRQRRTKGELKSTNALCGPALYLSGCLQMSGYLQILSSLMDVWCLWNTEEANQNCLLNSLDSCVVSATQKAS